MPLIIGIGILIGIALLASGTAAAQEVPPCNTQPCNQVPCSRPCSYSCRPCNSDCQPLNSCLPNSGTVVTSCGTGNCTMPSGITNDPATWPTGDKVWDVCRAIAIAEGAQGAGNAPDRYNNPGDLSKGDEHSQPIDGYTTLSDGENLIIFSSKEAGWTALYVKINNIRLGLSLTYRPSMTWTEISQKYAGNSGNWVANVTRELGVSPSDRFEDYFA